MRHRNNGVRKRCGCRRKDWPKCPHGWQWNFKPRGGKHWRLSLDVELGQHVGSKSEAETKAARIKVAILAGTFVRAADRRQPDVSAPTAVDIVTLKGFGQTCTDRTECSSMICATVGRARRRSTPLLAMRRPLDSPRI